MRDAAGGDGMPTKSLFDHSPDIWEVVHIGKGWETVAADDVVKFGLGALLDVGVR
jgi:hypothetical protein